MPYRVGLVGGGRKGLTIDDERKCPTNGCHGPASHVTAIAALPGVELTAIAERNEVNREIVCRRLPDVPLYQSHEEMLDREDLDIVAVATQTPDHAPVTIAAARKGVRAVICEKAIATSMAEADAMVDECEKAGTVLLVNHTRRYHPTFDRAKEAIERGEIGRLQLIVGTVGRGIVHNGTHFFDLFRLFAGDATAVSGRCAEPGDKDTGGYATVEFADGLTALLDAQSATEICLSLHGERGRIVIDSSYPGYEVVEYVDPPTQPSPAEWYKGGPCRERRSRLVNVMADDDGAMLGLYRDAIGAIEGAHTVRSSGRDGAAALEMSLAVFAATADGGRVPLPLRDRALRVISR
jgi:predicted dehydrogenase